MRILPAFLLALSTLMGASKILVTVVDPKSGVVVPNLNAEDFSVLDDQTPRPVEAGEFSHATLDIMMLLDTSLVGEMVHPLAANLIAQLEPKEQMAARAGCAFCGHRRRLPEQHRPARDPAADRGRGRLQPHRE